MLSLHELYLVGSVSWREGNLESGSSGPRGKCKGQCEGEGECVSVRVNVRDSVKGDVGNLCGGIERRGW